MGMKSGLSSLPLKDVIHSIQTQLMESEKEREEMNLPSLFTVKEVEIEMNFIVEKTISTKAEANIVVINADGEVDYREEGINKIKITLSTATDNNVFNSILGTRPNNA